MKYMATGGGGKRRGGAFLAWSGGETITNGRKVFSAGGAGKGGGGETGEDVITILTIIAIIPMDDLPVNRALSVVIPEYLNFFVIFLIFQLLDLLLDQKFLLLLDWLEYLQ